MAIIAVRETKRDGGLGSDGVRRYRRMFDVETDNLLTGALEVMIASGIPTLWQYYITEREYDLGATVRRVDPQHDEENPYLWHVTVEYSSEIRTTRTGLDPTGNIPSAGGGGGGGAGGGAGSEEERNPLLRPPEVEWSTVTYQEPALLDREDNPILNAADERFDPPPEVDRMRWQLTYSRNAASFSMSDYDFYRDTVNSTPIWGFPAHAVKLASIRSSRVFENELLYWKETFIFQMKSTWDLKILNAGYSKIVSGAKVPIEYKGKSLSEPSLLSSVGAVIAPGGTPIFLTFEAYNAVDYHDLDINP